MTGVVDDHTNEQLTSALEHVLDIEVAYPIEVGETGDGERRIVQVTDGTVSERVFGHVLPGARTTSRSAPSD